MRQRQKQIRNSGRYRNGILPVLILALIISFALPVIPARADSSLVALYKRLLKSVESVMQHHYPVSKPTSSPADTNPGTAQDLQDDEGASGSQPSESGSAAAADDPAQETQVADSPDSSGGTLADAEPPSESTPGSNDGQPAGTVSRILSVTLEWDPSPDSRVAGYLLYYGNASGKYLQPVDVGLETTYTVSGLDDDRAWYFSVKAYDGQGTESDYSNEVVKLPGENIRVVESDDPSVDRGPIALNQEFGVEPQDDSGMTQESSAGRGRIVAGIGSWPVNGGWVKALTGDFYHARWAHLEWDRYNQLNGETRVARGDIDGDGRDELIIGMGSAAGDDTVPNGTFEVLDDDLHHLCWGQIDWQTYNESNGETWPACGDLDGDGRDEILIGTGRGGQGNIEVFDFAEGRLQHRRWLASTWSEYNQAQGEVRPAVGDYDGDGRNDVIVGFGPVSESAQLPGGAYEVLAADGSHLAWGEVSWGDYNELNGETRPVVGDLDGDGRGEIVIGLGAGANGAFEIQQLDNLGRLVNQAWLEVPEWLEYNQKNGETRPAVGNLDDDPALEIAVALGPGGGGWVHLFDDPESGYRQFLSLELWPEKYNAGNGASWITIMENR
jgi:hypothetical protein